MNLSETPQCVECTPGYQLTDTDLAANELCLDCDYHNNFLDEADRQLQER